MKAYVGIKLAPPAAEPAPRPQLRPCPRREQVLGGELGSVNRRAKGETRDAGSAQYQRMPFPPGARVAARTPARVLLRRFPVDVHHPQIAQVVVPAEEEALAVGRQG